MNSSLRGAADAALLILFFFLLNLRALVPWYLLVDTTTLIGLAAQVELVLWMPTLLLMISLVWIRGDFGMFAARRRDTLPIVAVVAMCLLSSLWSIEQDYTLLRSLTLLAASLTSIYVALRYPLRELLRILFMFALVVTISSYVLAIGVPWLGTDLNQPYDGAWRGLFWHKNHLGTNAPFLALIFLTVAAGDAVTERKADRVAAIVGYVGALGLVYMSRSATGVVMAGLLHAALFLVWIWLRLRRSLRPMHYVGFGIVMSVAALALFSNMEQVFRLLGRSPTLTGRVSLWEHLLREWVSLRPLWGYGYGSLWSTDWFRANLQEALHWAYRIRIADNGFLDILLYLGVFGLALFLFAYGNAWFKAAQYALAAPTPLTFFPLLFLMLSLIGNISFSLFLEMELLVWFALVYFSLLKPPAAATRYSDVNKAPAPRPLG